MMERGDAMHQFTCPLCGDGFEQRSRYERHMEAAHPPGELSAADIEKALAGTTFPMSRAELIEYVAERLPPDSPVLRALEGLPERRYRDAAEVGVSFGETKRPTPKRPGPAAG